MDPPLTPAGVNPPEKKNYMAEIMFFSKEGPEEAKGTFVFKPNLDIK
jgi:hypothetical protein